MTTGRSAATVSSATATGWRTALRTMIPRMNSAIRVTNGRTSPLAARRQATRIQAANPSSRAASITSWGYG